MSLGGLFKKVGSLALKTALNVEDVHGPGGGLDKRSIVQALLQQAVPIILAKSGHDASHAEDLIQHGLSAVDEGIAFAKAVKAA